MDHRILADVAGPGCEEILRLLCAMCCSASEIFDAKETFGAVFLCFNS